MTELLYLLIYLANFMAGAQISIGDLKLLKGNIHYRLRLSNYIAYACAFIGVFLIGLDIYYNDILLYVISVIFTLGAAVIGVWIISKLGFKSIVITIIELVIGLFVVIFILKSFIETIYSIPFFIGLYYRNCPFGAPFVKKFLLLQHYEIPCFLEKKSTEYKIGTTDYTYAGKKKKFERLTVYDVTKYGVYPNHHEDALPKVQQLIDSIGEKGGIIFFPKGRYLFNKNGKKTDFIKINTSHIHIQGEVDDKGKPLSVLVNCNNTVLGTKNPWLSPFFITTGENIQESNIFWGLQFLKKKNIITKSASMSDPGSDGTILSPDYCTSIIAESKTGEDVVFVESTSALKKGDYIVIGLYNTTPDGNLIKDILGIEKLRPEWETARRAGEEQAPSYQWLIEIEQVIDKHKIKLTRPLLRDCPLVYSPKVFKAKMLEGIEIKDIKLASRWNGLFHHHGYHRYYSVAQAQEMDYGWNAINMKRVAHGKINNVIIQDFTNPLYILDSRNITVENLIIRGADGHQGIKLYEHACDNLFKNITFYNHFADMMGGEGNAYGNVFDNVAYCNPYFKPVDYDFHGFSEGPMSPPSHNLFININNFRYIKGAGAIYNQPACAQYNTWVNCKDEGRKHKDHPFVNIHYCHGERKIPQTEHREFFKNSIIK